METRRRKERLKKKKDGRRPNPTSTPKIKMCGVVVTNEENKEECGEGQEKDGKSVAVETRLTGWCASI